MSAADPPDSACRDCGADLGAATYCGACGQRRHDESERRLGPILRDALAAATNLDSRFWRTFLALLFRPGRLSRDYIDGRRRRWLPPVTVFVLVNLLYFLSPGVTDFTLPFADQVPGRIALQAVEDPARLSDSRRAYLDRSQGQLHSALTAPLVENRVAARNAAALEQSDGAQGYSMADYARAYETANDDVSKLLIGLHIPLLALALAALFPRARLYFAEHFVAALHMFSVIVLLPQLATLPLGLLAEFGPQAVVQAAFRFIPPVMLALIILHGALALRLVYRPPWWWLIAATALFILALGVAHMAVYRAVQFLVIFAIT